MRIEKYFGRGKVKSEKGESDVVLRRHSRKELLTRKDETGSRWRVYFVQLLNGGELREIGDCEGSGNEREKERMRGLVAGKWKKK